MVKLIADDPAFGCCQLNSVCQELVIMPACSKWSMCSTDIHIMADLSGEKLKVPFDVVVTA